MELTRWFYDVEQGAILDVNRFVVCSPRHPEDGPLLAIGPEAVEALIRFVNRWDASISEVERLRSAEELAHSVRSIVAQPWERVNEER